MLPSVRFDERRTNGPFTFCIVCIPMTTLLQQWLGKKRNNNLWLVHWNCCYGMQIMPSLVLNIMKWTFKWCFYWFDNILVVTIYRHWMALWKKKKKRKLIVGIKPIGENLRANGLFDGAIFSSRTIDNALFDDWIFGFYGYLGYHLITEDGNKSTIPFTNWNQVWLRILARKLTRGPINHVIYHLHSLIWLLIFMLSSERAVCGMKFSI